MVLPLGALAVLRQHELDRFVVAVQEDEQVVVGQAVAVGVDLRQRPPAEPHPDRADPPLVPLLVGHRLAVGAEPGQVLDEGAADLAPLEEAGSAEAGVGMARSIIPA
jgi:hypothetical protein